MTDYKKWYKDGEEKNTWYTKVRGNWNLVNDGKHHMEYFEERIEYANDGSIKSYSKKSNGKKMEIREFCDWLERLNAAQKEVA